MAAGPPGLPRADPFCLLGIPGHNAGCYQAGNSCVQKALVNGFYDTIIILREFIFLRQGVICLVLAFISGCGDGIITDRHTGSGSGSGLALPGKQPEKLILTTSPFIEMQLRQMLGGVQSGGDLEIMRIPGANASGHFTELTYGALKLIRDADCLIYVGGTFDRTLRSEVENASLRTGEKSELVLFGSLKEIGPESHPWMNPESGKVATAELGRWIGGQYPSVLPLIESNLPGMLDELQEVIDEIRPESSSPADDAKPGRGVLCTHNSIHTFANWLEIPVIDLAPIGDTGHISLAFSGRIRNFMAAGDISALAWDDQIQLPWLRQMADKHNLPSIVITTLEKKLPDRITYPEVIRKNFKAFRSVTGN